LYFRKANRIKLETLLLVFHPLIYKVLHLKPELEQNMLPFTVLLLENAE